LAGERLHANSIADSTAAGKSPTTRGTPCDLPCVGILH
jgi:hypothetical protein